MPAQRPKRTSVLWVPVSVAAADEPSPSPFGNLGQFAESRVDWFKIAILRNSTGQWEVVLRVDGPYPDEIDAVRAARRHGDDLLALARPLRPDEARPTELTFPGP